MNGDPLEVLSALLDGEAIAPDVLASALQTPGAREALVDFARLRAELAADDSRPSPALHRTMSRVLSRRASNSAGRVLRAVAAVVVLALAARGAMSLGTRLGGPAVEEPPRATRIIQFTPGVDWHEGATR
jgi:hypothetical protein